MPSQTHSPSAPDTQTLFTCPTCAGNGFVPTDCDGLEACQPCGGSGYATAEGDLGPSRSEKRRPYAYQPGCRRLTMWKGRKPTAYTVSEFSPDREFPGRAFQLRKEDGSTYEVLLGHEGCLCDCMGKESRASEWGNYRAFVEEREQFKTLGCKHLDAVHTLLVGGWLDLPEAAPVPLTELDPDYFS